MSTISLCMIVRNEEQVLRCCLDSICRLVDEILIADTGSTDLTKEIAKDYTEKIWDFPWIDDFSAARNFIISKARSEYFMWLDADDCLPAEQASSFSRLKEELSPQTDMVLLPYHTGFDSLGRPAFSCVRERLIRNRKGYCFCGRVHEAIPLSGNVIFRDIPVEHRKKGTSDPERNLKIYQNMISGGEPFEARDLYYYGRELLDHGDYEKSRNIFRSFLERKDGWAENKMDAVRQLACCSRALGQEQDILSILLTGLSYGVPSGELCCDLGRCFMEQNQYAIAAYWFRQALLSEKSAASGAFIQEECYGFYPAISLCVCYDRLGDLENAWKYNELAGTFQPESPYYLHNKIYLETSRISVQIS